MDENTHPGDESTNAPPAPEQDSVAPTQAGTPPPAENPVTEPTPPDAVPPPAPPAESVDETPPAPVPSEAHRVLLEIESRLHHLELLPSVTAQWFRDKLAELKRHL